MEKTRSAYIKRSERLANLARLLDDAFVIPGTKIRVGLDGIVGLIPGIGDFVMAGIGSFIVLEAVRIGAPWHVTGRMVFNLVTEGIIGSVPIIGDAFDIALKTNRRNLALLNKWIDRHPRREVIEIEPDADSPLR